MYQPDANLSPTSRALTAASTLGMLLLICMAVFMRAQAQWWMWALVIGLFIPPTVIIAFVERGARSNQS